MPMSGVTLGTAIEVAISGLSDVQKQNTALVWQTIATEITNHIADNATVTVTSVSGVTPGGGVSGPGTGTIA